MEKKIKSIKMRIRVKPFSPAHFALAIAACLAFYGAGYLLCVILVKISI